MRKLVYFALAAFATVALAQTSGFPSRPRFQAVGVGTTAPTQVGAITSNTTVNGSLDLTVDNDSNGTANAARLAVASGDASSAFFVAGSGRTTALVTNGPTGAQSVIRNLGSYPIVFGISNTRYAQLDAAVFTVYGATTGAADIEYVQFRNSGGTSSGYVGNASAGNSDIYLVNDIATGSINLQTAGGTITADGSIICRADGTGCPLLQTTGTFTPTFTGFAAPPSATASWSKVGNIVTLTFPLESATSNATTFSMTNLPAAIIPASTQTVPIMCIDNSNSGLLGTANFTGASATLAFGLYNSTAIANRVQNSTGAIWTAANNKGLSATTISYSIQ